MYPTLAVKINKELDKEMCRQFLAINRAGIDFGEGIIKVHSALASVRFADEQSSRGIIGKYFDEFYLKSGVEIFQKTQSIQLEWDSKAQSFFAACDKFFNNRSWPNGRYEAYLSIINCNPRFLNDKTFQFYWKNEIAFIPVAAHELLHFLFYDLAAELFPDIDIQNEKLWQVSEVFNGLIMAELEFTDLTQISRPWQYPYLLELQNKLRPLWDQYKQADKFSRGTLP